MRPRMLLVCWLASLAVAKPYAGLQNLGNTCYLNAQLQCAYHIPRVRNLVMGVQNRLDDDDATATTVDTDESSTTLSSRSGDNSVIFEEAKPVVTPALASLRDLFLQVKSASRASPRSFCSVLGIPPLVQQDSQEFWKLLLPALQLDALHSLYRGTYQEYIVALDGSGREKRKKTDFMDLSLDVVNYNQQALSSIQESLKFQFGDPERLSVAEGNGWRPEKGADPVDAHKGVQLLPDKHLPSILQLHLKRFHFDWNTETTLKLNHCVQFADTLSLAGCQYQLQSVLVHMGEYDSGHYYCYVRPDIDSDDWYRFNDETVERVSLEDVFRDGWGGKASLDSSSANDNQRRPNVLVRMLRSLLGCNNDSGDSDPYGFGGPQSSAYVLQFVKTCDISRLYNKKSL